MKKEHFQSRKMSERLLLRAGNRGGDKPAFGSCPREEESSTGEEDSKWSGQGSATRALGS